MWCQWVSGRVVGVVSIGGEGSGDNRLVTYRNGGVGVGGW